MRLFIIFSVVLVLLMVTREVYWRIRVRQALMTQGLERVHDLPAPFTPPQGYRFIEAYTCERDGKEVRVVIMNRGWLRIRPFVQISEI